MSDESIGRGAVDAPPGPGAAWPLVARRVERLNESIAAVDPVSFDRAATILRRAHLTDSCIFVTGNGGSSATASHWVNDLHKTTTRPGRRGVRAISLTDNVALLTALANDDGYESVFSQQLASHLGPTDVLVVISVSGCSPNLVAAAEYARRRGVDSIGLLGWDGGTLADLVTEAVVVPAPRGEYPVVESAHLVLCDALCEAVAG